MRRNNLHKTATVILCSIAILLLNYAKKWSLLVPTVSNDVKVAADLNATIIGRLGQNASFLLPLDNKSVEKKQERGILLHWVAGDPLQRGRGQFVYYYDAAQAFMQTDGVTVCNNDIPSCMKQAQQSGKIYAPAFCHSASNDQNTKGLRRKASSTAKQLSASLANETENTPCVSVLFMLNKAYQNLEGKVHAFKRAFDAHNLTSREGFNLIATTWAPHAVEWSHKFGLPFLWIPFATDVDLFEAKSYPTWEVRQCDLFIGWDTNVVKYKHRLNISTLLALNKSDTFADLTIESPNYFLNEQKYLEMIKNCRMHVSTIGMPGTVDLIGTRYYEIMASGSSLLIVERPETDESVYSYKENGLVEGETVAMFSNVSELVSKIRYYKRNSAEAKSIISSARALSSNYSWNVRGKRFVQLLRQTVTCASVTTN